MDIVRANEVFLEVQADADLDQVLFFPFSGAPPDTVAAAAFHPPGELPTRDELSVFSEADATRLLEGQAEYRVVLSLGLAEPLVAPVLRHELEHVRQWKFGGGKPIFQLAGIERDALHRDYPSALPASGMIYNLNPIELDANGAASAFIRRSIGAAKADRLAATLDPGVFRSRPAPEPYDTLGTRLICHGTVWSTEVEQGIRRAFGNVEAFFDAVASGGGQLWHELNGDIELTELRAAVTDAIPTRPALSHDESPSDYWAPTKLAVGAAVDRARSLAGLSPTPRLSGT